MSVFLATLPLLLVLTVSQCLSVFPWYPFLLPPFATPGLYANGFSAEFSTTTPRGDYEETHDGFTPRMDESEAALWGWHQTNKRAQTLISVLQPLPVGSSVFVQKDWAFKDPWVC